MPIHEGVSLTPRQELRIATTLLAYRLVVIRVLLFHQLVVIDECHAHPFQGRQFPMPKGALRDVQFENIQTHNLRFIIDPNG
jgi:hypothetical protein